MEKVSRCIDLKTSSIRISTAKLFILRCIAISYGVYLVQRIEIDNSVASFQYGVLITCSSVIKSFVAMKRKSLSVDSIFSNRFAI